MITSLHIVSAYNPVRPSSVQNKQLNTEKTSTVRHYSTKIIASCSTMNFCCSSSIGCLHYSDFSDLSGMSSAANLSTRGGCE